MSRFPFAPFPSGWFWVASSVDLKPGQHLSRRIFGQDVVVFRGASGTVRVMEAHCPHLGAHLGHGGRVVGDAIVCPFHGWRLSGEDGRVLDVPYSDRKPPKVCVRTWPLREVDGQILIWHHPAGEAPTWEPPTVPEASDPAWTGLLPARQWRIRTHVQELAENGVDNAHFTFLHDQQTAGMETRGIDSEGPYFAHRTWQQYAVFGLAKRLVDKVEGPLTIHLHGLGIYVNRATVHAGIDLDYTFVFYAVPVDVEEVQFVSFLSMKRLPSRIATWLLWRKAVSEGGFTIDQDVPIWENKQYKPRPVLVAEDGPIHPFRRWARQFYLEGASGAEAAK